MAIWIAHVVSTRKIDEADRAGAYRDDYSSRSRSCHRGNVCCALYPSI